jgi:hypothetical protein
MIRVKLSGGLGNQLFQYACARSLSLRLNTGVQLDLEKLHYDDQRQFSLSKLNIQASLYKHKISGTKWNAIKYKLEQVIFPYETLIDPVWAYDQRIFNTKKRRLILDGYWGMVGYFENLRSILLKEIQLKAPFHDKIGALAATLQQQESVSIHLRFGDYVSQPFAASFFGTLPPDYYKAAIQHISQKLQHPVFYVFSDDKSRAVELLKKGTEIACFNIINEHGDYDDVEELFIMAACKHNIIANSTYSWWASWLNQHPEKIIIHPKQWFRDEKAQRVADNIQPLFQHNSILL